ncbi:MAG TPA: aldehyde dehydrogenase [Streptosporangiaceae bacterium]
MKVYDRLFIGGQWVSPASDARLNVISPATEEPVGSVPEAVNADIDGAVTAARKAFDHGPWPRTDAAERAAVLERLSEAITARAEEFAQTISTEMGSPIGFSRLGQLLAEVIADIGLPPGVVSIVPADREVGEYLVTHPGVDKVSFTGSTAAGRRIASLCGERLRRVTLELGGKSAAVLLPDVDLDTAIPAVVGAGLMNNGEACVAQTRILAPDDRYDEVAEALAAAVAETKVGDPLDENTEVGPLVSAAQRERVEGYLAAGTAEGAKVAVGGGRPDGFGRGWYVEPTVFVDVDNGMRIAQEEIFGPVLSLIRYRDVDEAVAIANDSRYGLSGSVWTEDNDAGLEVARRIRTGTYNVNTFMLENCAPFGGYKDSGLGRELGPEGLAAYVEYQSVNMPYGWTP